MTFLSIKRLSIKRLFKQLGLVVLACYAFGLSTSGYAETIQLTVKPKKCVSLYQGQACYQKFKLSWYVADQPVCLYIAGQQAPETCSEGASKAVYTYDFAGSEGITFELRDSKKNIIARNKVKVVSVYKGKSRLRSTTGWRLF